MTAITSSEVDGLVATAAEHGLPPVAVAAWDDTSVTLHVADRTAVAEWAARLETPLVDEDGTVSTGFEREGYLLRVVAQSGGVTVTACDGRLRAAVSARDLAARS